MIGKVWLSMSSAPNNPYIVEAPQDAFRIVMKTPTVEFSNRVPSWFIQEFLNFMAKDLIKVRDSDGKKLEVRMY
jgi:hypothetical protein